MESPKEISPQLCRVFLATVRAREGGTSPGWLTTQEIADEARVNPRTSRLHCTRLVEAGVFEWQGTFPHRFRYKYPPSECHPLIERIFAAICTGVMDVRMRSTPVRFVNAGEVVLEPSQVPAFLRAMTGGAS